MFLNQLVVNFPLINGNFTAGQPAEGTLDEHERHGGVDKGGAVEAASFIGQARRQAEPCSAK